MREVVYVRTFEYEGLFEFEYVGAVVTLPARVFLWTCVFISLGQTPSSGVAGLLSRHSVDFINNQPNLSGWIILHSHQQRMRTLDLTPPPPRPHQRLVTAVS